MTVDSSNLGLLYFVVALIYVCFIGSLLWNSSGPLFSCKRYPNTKGMKVFRFFFGSLWLQTVLNCTLYWILFANAVYIE